MVSTSSVWTDEIIAYYKLDEATGTNAIDSVGNQNGTLLTGVNWTAGKLNNATIHTDVNHGINLSHNDIFDLYNDFTVSAWIKTTDSRGGRHIVFGRSNGFAMGTDGNNYAMYYDRATGQKTGSINVSDGNWHHIVVVRDATSNSASLYTDGVLDISNNNSQYSSQSNKATRIGSSADGDGIETFDGSIDEVGIWNRTLTETEILYLYNSGNARPFAETLSVITLSSPTNNIMVSDSNINFTANFNISGINLNYTWKNATFNIWKGGVIFNSTTVNLNGNNTQYTLQVNDFIFGNYEWNVLGWFGNNTYNENTNAMNNYSFQWRPFEIINQSYDNYVYETESKRFSLNITTIEDILSVTTKLNYNGTLYNAETISSGGGNYSIYSDIDIPLVYSGESTNYSFYWQVTVYDGTTSYSFNTTEDTLSQNVTRIHLEVCNGTYTTQTLNFTAYDENNLTRINPFKISGTFNFWLGSGSITRNNSFNNLSTNDLRLCLTPTHKTQYTNAQLEYSYTDVNITYVPRDYYFVNSTISNSSQNINLYLLDAEDSTSFIIKVQDQSLNAVTDALVYIQRYYPGDGTFKTVQIAKTDSNGETIGFYETETVDYRHIIIKDGVILLTTVQQKVVGKEVPYTLTFTTGSSLDYPWKIFEKDSNVYSSLSYNKTTKIVTFTYIDVTGATTSARLLVYRVSNSNSTNTTICDSTSTESSATITCNMSSYDGSFVAYGYIESDVTDLIPFVITSARDILGNEGLLIGLFIILVSGFTMIWNPSAGIVAINVAIIFTNIMGFISVSPVFIFGSIAVSFIAIILLKT